MPYGDINLLPQTFEEETRKQDLFKKVSVFCVVSLAVLAILVGSSYFYHQYIVSEWNNVSEEVARVRSYLNQEDPRSKRINLRVIESKVTGLEKFFSTRVVSAGFFEAVLDNVPAGIIMSHLKVDKIVSRDQEMLVSFSGEASDGGAIEIFVKNLREMEGVEMVEIRKVDNHIQQGKLIFDLLIRRRYHHDQTT